METKPHVSHQLSQIFFAGFVQKMPMTQIKLFSVTSMNFGFTLNVTNLII